MKRLIAVPTFLALLSAASAQMPPTPGTNSGPQQQTGASSSSKGDSPDKLAQEFSVPKDEVNSLRAQGLSWSDVRNALAISRKAGVSADDVVKQKQSGLSWDSISQKYGFSLKSAPGSVGSKNSGGGSSY